jgi:hypothetical protein
LSPRSAGSSAELYIDTRIDDPACASTKSTLGNPSFRRRRILERDTDAVADPNERGNGRPPKAGIALFSERAARGRGEGSILELFRIQIRGSTTEANTRRRARRLVSRTASPRCDWPPSKASAAVDRKERGKKRPAKAAIALFAGTFGDIQMQVRIDLGVVPHASGFKVKRGDR